MINTPILSCDSHVSEPEDLWSSHLPEEDLFRSPAYGRIKDDKKIFKANGKIISVTDEYRRYYRDGELVVVNPRVLPDDVVAEPIERDDLEGRLRDMEHDHIYAETLAPQRGPVPVRHRGRGIRHALLRRSTTTMCSSATTASGSSPTRSFPFGTCRSRSPRSSERPRRDSVASSFPSTHPSRSRTTCRSTSPFGMRPPPMDFPSRFMPAAVRASTSSTGRCRGRPTATT